MTRLSGALPAGDTNGLTTVARELVEHPARRRVIIAVIDTKTVRRDVDSGTQTATIRVRAIEVIDDQVDRQQARRLLTRQYERRSGQLTLPLELENEIRAAFDDAERTDDDV